MLAVTFTVSSSKHETGENQRWTPESHTFVETRTHIFLEHGINLFSVLYLKWQLLVSPLLRICAVSIHNTHPSIYNDYPLFG